MPARPFPSSPGGGSPHQSSLKRFSVFTALPKVNIQDMSDGGGGSHAKGKKKMSPNGSGGKGGSSPQLQYSESMPVLDATAPYAVSSSANVVISSASSPSSRPQRSFDSDRLGYRSGSPHRLPQRPVSPLSQTTHSTLDEPAQGQTGASARPSTEKRRTFFSSPLTRNSFSSLRFLPPQTPELAPSISEMVSETASETPQRPDYHIKIVCVGDGGCGKTCLMLTYTYGTFPTTYTPTVFENYLTNVRSADGKLIELALWDTAGQEEYDRLRVLSYPEVNLLLVCFAIDSPTSKDNVLEKWVPEISHFCPDIPFILVGLKSDIRDGPFDPSVASSSPAQTYVTPEQGKALASRIGANRYMECSAKFSKGISNVFNTAISIVLAGHLGIPEPAVEDVYIEPSSPPKKSMKKSFKFNRHSLMSHKPAKEPKEKSPRPTEHAAKLDSEKPVKLSEKDSHVPRPSSIKMPKLPKPKLSKPKLSITKNTTPDALPKPVTSIPTGKKKKKSQCIIL